MAGFASIVGLLLQVVLVVIVARLLFAWWQRRNRPAPAYAAVHPATGHRFDALGGMLGSINARPAGEPLSIAKSDYDAVERLLGNVQAAYSTEDLWPCARRSRPKCCPISPSSWRATRVAVNQSSH